MKETGHIWRNVQVPPQDPGPSKTTTHNPFLDSFSAPVEEPASGKLETMGRDMKNLFDEEGISDWFDGQYLHHTVE